jgi:hypothetical protein
MQYQIIIEPRLKFLSLACYFMGKWIILNMRNRKYQENEEKYIVRTFTICAKSNIICET